MTSKKILIIFAHPALQKSRINRVIYKSFANIPNLTVNNLYEEYPDFHIDVKKEQELLLAHDIIIFQHPFYWYSAPSIIKEWIDLVLEHDFAYGRKGKALAGKWILNSISAGGSREAYCREGYNNFTILELLAPFQQTAKLCTMKYLPPFVIHGTHLLKEKDLEEHIMDYHKIIKGLQNNEYTEGQFSGAFYLNDLAGLKLNTKENA